jgi:hypothetical protein
MAFGTAVQSDPIPDLCDVVPSPCVYCPAIGPIRAGNLQTGFGGTAMRNGFLEDCAVLQRFVDGIIPFDTKGLQFIKTCATVGMSRATSFEGQTIFDAPRKFALHQNNLGFQSF